MESNNNMSHFSYERFRAKERLSVDLRRMGNHTLGKNMDQGLLADSDWNSVFLALSTSARLCVPFTRLADPRRGRA